MRHIKVVLYPPIPAFIPSYALGRAIACSCSKNLTLVVVFQLFSVGYSRFICMSVALTKIRQDIIAAPDNSWAQEQGWEPVYSAYPAARILIVGQAPGKRAQETKLPWNDPSGDNLRKWLGVTRETFYDTTKIALLPMDFYFPGSQSGGDKPPRPEFAPTWHPKLLAAMPKIELTLLLGAYAQKYYLGQRSCPTLTATVRNFAAYMPEYLPLVHPSPRNNIWQKKNPWFLREVVPILQQRTAQILA